MLLDIKDWDEFLSVLSDYADDLWGPCDGWPKFAIYERSYQQWAYDEIDERLVTAWYSTVQTTSTEVVQDYIRDMTMILREFENDGIENTLMSNHDMDYTEMFKVAIRTAKDILHAIADYYAIMA